MKNLTFNRNSWHYRLAEKYPPNLSRDEARDLCTYVRYVIRGIFVVGFLIGATSYLSASAIMLPLMSYLIEGHIDLPEIFIPGLLIFLGLIICFIVISLFAGLAYLFYTSISKQYIAKDSFIVTAWKSFKEKTCFLISFK